MQTLKIEATPRADFGKKASRAIRREGQVPCVLYGGGETVSFSVDAKALKPLIYTPNSYIVELTIGGKTEKAVMREVQFHPVREEILHIDFYRVLRQRPGRQTARRDHRRRDDAGRGQDDLRGRPQIGRPEIPDPRHHGRLRRSRNACFARRRSGGRPVAVAPEPKRLSKPINSGR